MGPKRTLRMGAHVEEPRWEGGGGAHPALRGAWDQNAGAAGHVDLGMPASA